MTHESFKLFRYPASSAQVLANINETLPALTADVNAAGIGPKSVSMVIQDNGDTLFCIGYDGSAYPVKFNATVIGAESDSVEDLSAAMNEDAEDVICHDIFSVSGDLCVLLMLPA